MESQEKETEAKDQSNSQDDVVRPGSQELEDQSTMDDEPVVEAGDQSKETATGDTPTNQQEAPKSDTIIVNRDDFNALIQRVGRLEQFQTEVGMDNMPAMLRPKNREREYYARFKIYEDEQNNPYVIVGWDLKPVRERTKKGIHRYRLHLLGKDGKITKKVFPLIPEEYDVHEHDPQVADEAWKDLSYGVAKCKIVSRNTKVNERFTGVYVKRKKVNWEQFRTDTLPGKVPVNVSSVEEILTVEIPHEIMEHYGFNFSKIKPEGVANHIEVNAHFINAYC